MFVKFKSYQSSQYEVLSGVPQGSVLGPLLFVSMVNDVGVVLKASELLMLADDLKLFLSVSCRETCDRLQTYLAAVAEWCEQSNLSLDILKCATMCTAKCKEPIVFDYAIETVALQRVTEVADFGFKFNL